MAGHWRESEKSFGVHSQKVMKIVSLDLISVDIYECSLVCKLWRDTVIPRVYRTQTHIHVEGLPSALELSLVSGSSFGVKVRIVVI